MARSSTRPWISMSSFPRSHLRPTTHLSTPVHPQPRPRGWCFPQLKARQWVHSGNGPAPVQGASGSEQRRWAGVKVSAAYPTGRYRKRVLLCFHDNTNRPHKLGNASNLYHSIHDFSSCVMVFHCMNTARPAGGAHDQCSGCLAGKSAVGGTFLQG